MALSPVLLEALGSVAVIVIGSGVVAPLAFVLGRMISGHERTVAVKLASGKEVRLELDSRLSQEEVSGLVAEAVRSAQSGDEAAVERTVIASRAASREARERLPAG